MAERSRAAAAFDPSRLRRRRAAAGLTQADLAGRLGVDRTHVVHWENGRRRPSTAHLAQLASALGVRPADLLDPARIPSGLEGLRVSAGLTQTELADRAQVPRSTYSLLERSSEPPPGAIAGRLAEALGVSVTEVDRAIAGDG